ncbi:MAG: type VI secretion system tip protein TssI/VgrG [Candidatus Competibacteraceae bacterium]
MQFHRHRRQDPYRSPRIAPKPVIQGPQTAIVVGPTGEEIYTDQYGRVKCQFHWDRYGRADQDSSCWIRVAQNWAGKKWGRYIPRIGHEVIVEHEEGDPDRPLITGQVYNGTNMPPYGLPDNMTMSTLKSLSSGAADSMNCA